MARLWSSGYELNTTGANVEFTTNSGLAIQSAVIRSGSFGQKKIAASSNVQADQTIASSNLTTDQYIRFYMRTEAYPSALRQFCRYLDTSPSTKVELRMNTDGTLELWNVEDTAQVGSDSSALSLNTWYLIELRIDTTTVASTALDARIDGVSFASGTVNLANGGCRFTVGFTGDSSAIAYHDDIAFNNSSGSFQNSWAGSGKIIHLLPNAAGDNSDWTNDYQSVDEITPDDATTLVSSNTLDQIDDHNIFNADSLSTTDVISVVQVGVRFNGAGASANASFVLRIKATASGTVEESAAITPSNTTWVTNAAASPRNYSLTLYDLPGASTTSWSKSTLDTAQIGYRLSATSTNAAQISTLWLLVDYVPDSNRIQITNVTSAQVDAASSLTFTHVTPSSDTNRLLVVTTQTEDNANGADMDVTGVTYNSVALTKIRADNTGAGSNDRSEIWYLINPATGSNSVVVSYSGSIEGSVAQAISIKNAAQSGQPDANNGTNNNNATPSVSVTTTTTNCLVIDSTAGSGSTNIFTPDGSQQLNAQEANSGQMVGVTSYKLAESSGSVTLAYAVTSELWAMSAASFKQFVAGGVSSGNDWPILNMQGNFWSWRF